MAEGAVAAPEDAPELTQLVARQLTVLEKRLVDAPKGMVLGELSELVCVDHVVVEESLQLLALLLELGSELLGALLDGRHDRVGLLLVDRAVCHELPEHVLEDADGATRAGGQRAVRSACRPTPRKRGARGKDEESRGERDPDEPSHGSTSWSCPGWMWPALSRPRCGCGVVAARTAYSRGGV